jgi:hypothetical protein
MTRVVLALLLWSLAGGVGAWAQTATVAERPAGHQRQDGFVPL